MSRMPVRDEFRAVTADLLGRLKENMRLHGYKVDMSAIDAEIEATIPGLVAEFRARATPERLREFYDAADPERPVWNVYKNLWNATHKAGETYTKQERDLFCYWALWYETALCRN